MKKDKRKYTARSLNKVLTSEDFVDFFCYWEDKWLQYADWNVKIPAIFGSLESAIEAFENDCVHNKNNEGRGGDPHKWILPLNSRIERKYPSESLRRTLSGSRNKLA
jgi:hypothetical protein